MFPNLKAGSRFSPFLFCFFVYLIFWMENLARILCENFRWIGTKPNKVRRFKQPHSIPFLIFKLRSVFPITHVFKVSAPHNFKMTAPILLEILNNFNLLIFFFFYSKLVDFFLCFPLQSVPKKWKNEISKNPPSVICGKRLSNGKMLYLNVSLCMPAKIHKIVPLFARINVNNSCYQNH